MEPSKRVFNIANLTEVEKQRRQAGIEFLFAELLKKDGGLLMNEVEQLYDKMQQSAIDAGLSSWEFYQAK